MVLVAPRRKRVYTASEVRGDTVGCEYFLYYCFCAVNAASDLPEHLQVATHSTPSDCWVSLLGRVLDLTSLLRVRA